MTGDLDPIGEVMGRALAGLGLNRLDLMIRLHDEWEQLVSAPWQAGARPMLLRGSHLVVEATTPAAIRLLRYAESDLIASLDRSLGAGVVKSVEVRAPRRENPQ